MEYIKIKKHYKVNSLYLKEYLQTFWYIPSDVLQRGMEANIWKLCTFKSKVLDIGVGNGEISKFIFRTHSKIDVGIDIEKEGLEEAFATGKYIKVLQMNAEKMLFKDKEFYTVVSNSTFEHMDNDLKALSEVSRVLKKNGLFFITIPSVFLQQWILEYEQKKDSRTAKKSLNAFNTRIAHYHYRSLKEWEKNFKKNDMEIVFSKYFFPKEVALLWYKLFKIFTIKIRERELWSYIGQSKLTRAIPKKMIITLLEKKILKNAYENGFFTDTEGGQLFIIARKSK